jgi:2-oxoisovalerate dehydrogenase E1 component alpha subunit
MNRQNAHTATMVTTHDASSGPDDGSSDAALSGDGPPPEPAALLWRIYRAMAAARACDERMWILQRQGRARFVVTGRGHEAAQAGSAPALRAGHDYVLTYYRSMALVLALGVTPEAILRNALGREGDPFSGGRQMPNHFSSRALRIPTQSSCVGGGMTHAVGCAYAAKVRGEDFVTACYFGEGATAKGDFHEALNFAAIHRLPVIFFCENNGWAISVPYSLEAPGPVASRAKAYLIPGYHVDGLDPLACYRAMGEAVARARAGDGPTLIEARCLRMVPHSSDDDDVYRSAEERAALQAADPLPAFRGKLLAWGVAGEAEIAAVDAEIRAEIRAAAQRALQAPPASDATSHLYGPAPVGRGAAAGGAR